MRCWVSNEVSNPTSHISNLKRNMKSILYKDWNELELAYSWIRDMKNVPQDPIHHAEGDVAIHTQMVLQELMADKDYQTLIESEKELLWCAALLHDVEKRSTTVIENDGRITSHGHARRGELSTREILFKEIPVDFVVREHVAALVRYHGLPLWILEKLDPLKSLLEASSRVNLRLLYLLAKADILGRICGDRNEMLERVEFFKAFCIEQNCWAASKQFANGHGRFHYFNSESTAVDYVPFDDLKCEVILMSALPGMGKDHFIRKHFADYPVVSLDDIRRKHKIDPTDKAANGWVVQEAKEQARVYLRRSQSFVWNATNITRQMRSQQIDLFSTYQARIKIVYIETSYNQWLKQNKNRDFALPQQVMDKMLKKLEVPHVFEAHEVEYVIG
ncbi:HD domain protein [compost metagenome]